ncbi:uncharacterized protein DUF4354 [Raoultella sp. BIGb0138]|uniref:DUF4354 family protein n=1 Tax=Raoultella sp. BIGb0138 TaxID=2485115 RepID=UPI00104780D4|nr:DUF4354 family protein [Raoultella sp. BIGb0138]TCW08614.1 uncharacterized protein DUF4354 [Raoultella sp. BIGb0138]
MKMVKALFVSSFILVSFSSVAAEDLHNKLVIEAIPASEGTVVIAGEPKYEKTFNLVVTSKTNDPIELTGFVGCYRAFDEKGKEFDERTVQLDLLGTLKDGAAKTGHVSFISDDDAVYNAKFVKWSTQCPHLAKRAK